MRTTNRRHRIWHSQRRKGVVRKRQANRQKLEMSVKTRVCTQCQSLSILATTPKGTRTPVLAVRGLCPRPLDDGGKWLLFCNRCRANCQADRHGRLLQGK